METACYDEDPLGQKLDPFTGRPSTDTLCRYSATMRFYLYGARRLGII